VSLMKKTRCTQKDETGSLEFNVNVWYTLSRCAVAKEKKMAIGSQTRELMTGARLSAV